MTFDPRLYLVTGPVPLTSVLEDVVAQALAGGATAVQLRDKTADRDSLQRQTLALAAIARSNGAALLVNDDLVAAAMADGAHVGVSDARPEKVRAELGETALIGWSINSLNQFDDVEALGASDYVAVSPVWTTPSKSDTTAPLGLEGVRAVRARTPAGIPVVAIGGITAANAAGVIAAGADGIAVMSAICSAHNPYAAALELREIVDAALSIRGQSR